MGWEQIPGWNESDVHRIYQRAVNEAKEGDTLVEVGVAYGKSLALLTRLALDSKKRIRIVGVDSWKTPENQIAYGGEGNDPQSEYLRRIVRENGGQYEACVSEMLLKAPEEYRNCHLVRMSSVEAARKMPLPISFAFIDADHSYQAVREDIAAWGPKVRPGGILAGHDFYGEAERAVRDAFQGRTFTVDGCVWIHEVQ